MVAKFHPPIVSPHGRNRSGSSRQRHGPSAHGRSVAIPKRFVGAIAASASSPSPRLRRDPLLQSASARRERGLMLDPGNPYLSQTRQRCPWPSCLSPEVHPRERGEAWSFAFSSAMLPCPREREDCLAVGVRARPGADSWLGIAVPGCVPGLRPPRFRALPHPCIPLEPFVRRASRGRRPDRLPPRPGHLGLPARTIGISSRTLTPSRVHPRECREAPQLWLSASGRGGSYPENRSPHTR